MSAAQRKQRVLVVDDEPQVLVALEDLLGDEFSITKTESSESALRLVENEKDIAVVISDQRMPRMNGDELFSRLEGRSEATRILVTGFSDLPAVIRAVNDGRIFAYVTKPWRPDDLRLMVHRGAEYFRVAQELAYERNLLRDLMDSVPDGIYFKDLDLNFLRVNRPLATVLNGGDSEAMVGKRLAQITPGDPDSEGTETGERRVLETGEPSLDVVRELTRDGRRLWVSESKAPIRDPGGSIVGLVGISRDVTERLSFAIERVAQAEQVNFLSYYDSLTKLPNRELFRDRVTQHIATCTDEKRKLGVLLLDIGRFRHVNETLGRRGGDEVLVQVAARLDGVLAPQDTLGRFDGNTFAVLVGEVDDEADIASFIENRVGPSLREPFVVEGTELRLSIRSGIALFPSDGADADALLRNAEAALKKTKAVGHGYMFYAPSMNARVAERLTLETKLRRAVENEEFLLHYQPKVNFKTGVVAGLEALIRWQDPSTGLVPPGQFIPVLEDTGLILEVGRWVVRRAAAQHEEWTARGLEPPRIAVNVSAIQLAQRDFIASLDAILGQYPRAAEGIDLEITESVFVEDFGSNAEKLHAARERGFEVALDDFGTGYSSLGYLSRLPIDTLKIDRSFVVRMVENPEDTAIVTTIISLAHALDLKVVAEGVETMQQAQLLRLLKCDQMQGYLTARPLAAVDVEKVLGVTLLRLGARNEGHAEKA